MSTYIVRWHHATRSGSLKTRCFSAFEDAQRFHGELKRHSPATLPQLLDLDCRVYHAGRWMQEGEDIT